MADKRISSSTHDFTIPKVPGRDKSREVLIRIADPNKHDVYQKDMPTDLPDGYDWINSFGIKTRHADAKIAAKTSASTAADPYPHSVDAYTIELDDVPGKEPVYFSAGSVQSFPAAKTSVGNNRVQVSLTLGDPPIGWPK